MIYVAVMLARRIHTGVWESRFTEFGALDGINHCIAAMSSIFLGVLMALLVDDILGGVSEQVFVIIMMTVAGLEVAVAVGHFLIAFVSNLIRRFKTN